MGIKLSLSIAAECQLILVWKDGILLNVSAIDIVNEPRAFPSRPHVFDFGLYECI